MDNDVKTVAYLRVSTGSQNLANQKLAILEHARQKHFAVDRFVEVQASSRQGPDQRRSDQLLDSLRAGDRLVVSDLSRLGRSLGQVIRIVEELVKRKIRFTAIKENIHFEGKQDLQTKVMIALGTYEGRTGCGKGQGQTARPPQRSTGQVQARRQGGRNPHAPAQAGLQGLYRQDRGHLQDRPASLY